MESLISGPVEQQVKVVDERLAMRVEPGTGRARLAFWQPLREAPTAADRKGIAVLTAHSLLLSVVMFMAPKLQWAIQKPSLGGNLVLGACGVLIALVLIGGCSAFLAMITPLPNPGASLAWLRNIGALGRDEYLARMHGMTDEQAMGDALQYNYSLAVQAARKYRLVERSISCFQAAMLLWMGLMLLEMAAG